MLKILSWNIRQGGGSRLKGIKTYINNSSAQIVILSEFRNGMTGLNLRHSLLLNGYRYQAVSAAKADANSVIIASKIPFNSNLFQKIDDVYSSNVLAVEFSAFKLYGCYLPHKKKHKLFNFLIEEVESNASVIIAGDLNTGINGVDQKGDSFWYEDEFKGILDSGMVDAFRLINGKVKEYSWYSHKLNGYRYDHILTSATMNPIIMNCYYDHNARIDGLSDHSPMFLELG